MGLAPHQVLGLTTGSYEAYCLDQAIWYFGMLVTHDLEKAGVKKQKGQAAQESARKRVLAKHLGEGDSGKRQYADPAALFG